MQIVVPSREEFSNTKAHEQNMQDGKVNLNSAQLQELCTLSGIGEAKAEAILAYRDEIGRFSSIEQLKNVAGIGESLFERIKESIYIE
jgi:competence protein ComEA